MGYSKSLDYSTSVYRQLTCFFSGKNVDLCAPLLNEYSRSAVIRFYSCQKICNFYLLLLSKNLAILFISVRKSTCSFFYFYQKVHCTLFVILFLPGSLFSLFVISGRKSIQSSFYFSRKSIQSSFYFSRKSIQSSF